MGIQARLSLGLLTRVCASTLMVGLLYPVWSMAAVPLTGKEAEALKQAQVEFAAENFDRAIFLYQKYLKRHGTHWDVVSQLGASYYHAGLAKKALDTLRYSYSRTNQKSFAALYLGMTYEIMGRPDLAIRYWTIAAGYKDTYAGQAVFELAVFDYNRRDSTRAIYWLNAYVTRFPSGRYVRLAIRMQQSLHLGRWLGRVQGLKKPSLEAALYRYSGWSLMERPHFWSTQLGYWLDFGTQKDPAPEGSERMRVRTSQFQDQAISFSGSLGFGPVRSRDSEGTAGYSYRQNWLTDNERVNDFIESPSNIAYQPFQLDLLERRHQLFGDYRKMIGSNFLAGVYGTFDYSLSGSRLSTDSILSQVVDVGETTLMVPWIGVSYLENFNTLFYLYLRKELSRETPEFSNMTYHLFTDDPSISFGLSHYMGFPNYGFDMSVELFKYEFVYNDFWLDFSRLGGILRMRYEFLPNFFVHGYVGTYTDSFLVPVLKQGGCDFTLDESVNLTNGESEIDLCDREDTGLLYQGALFYNWSPNLRLDLSYTHVSNSSPSQIVYDRTSNRVIFTVTMAFPSVERSLRYTNRFQEALFRKDIE